MKIPEKKHSRAKIDQKMGVTGFEPNSVTDDANTTCVNEAVSDRSRAAESGAVVFDSRLTDPDLMVVIDRWSALSPEQRRTVLAIVCS